MKNQSRKKGPKRPRTGVYKPMARSRITNGHALLSDIDHRTLWVRRFRDVLALHLSDLGGEDSVSEAEKTMILTAFRHGLRAAELVFTPAWLITQKSDVGCAGSHLRTRLRLKFPANREKYWD